MKRISPAICSGCVFISMALKSDGTVRAWGVGTLGDGNRRGSNTPVQVQDLSEVTAIASRQALRADGTVWTWGGNEHGRLGDGTNSPRFTPVQVKELSGVIAISQGLALRADGTVWAWGWNPDGQLGDGTNKDRRTPVQVQNSSGIMAVSNGGCNYSLALREDGTVWAWGKNENGNLGDGTYENRGTPVQVSGLNGVMAISAYHNSFALKKDGTVWAWGNNSIGGLGDGTTTHRNAPVQVQGLDGVTAISAGSAHTLALRNDGTVWAWGANLHGQLGNGTATEYDTVTHSHPPHPVPIQVQNLNGVTAVSAGTQHSLALKNDGTVWAWGRNIDGELGDGTFVDKHSPVQVVGAGGKGFLKLNAN